MLSNTRERIKSYNLYTTIMLWKHDTCSLAARLSCVHVVHLHCCVLVCIHTPSCVNVLHYRLKSCTFNDFQTAKHQRFITHLPSTVMANLFSREPQFSTVVIFLHQHGTRAQCIIKGTVLNFKFTITFIDDSDW